MPEFLRAPQETTIYLQIPRPGIAQSLLAQTHSPLDFQVGPSSSPPRYERLLTQIS
ncbi:MAG TPA: hypothetical protein VKB46_19800 [Pyrinomonadaceae bacterium]|nr:hypothetical protein [Pyrinomonadaceae bacterium]